ncbi:MAG: urease accessory protein UreF [Acidimicrobiales bacterium]
MSGGRPGSWAALLLLGDGRLPAGGHVHSGGVESAVEDRRIVDLESLAEFTAGRVRTTGLVDAALAAATAGRLAVWHDDLDTTIALLDSEAAARLPSPPLRAASRRQGRQLLRTAIRCWPSPVLDVAASTHSEGPHQSIALGAVVASVGLGPTDAARLVLHHAMTTPTQAAVRLLGLDPYGAASICADLAPLADAVAAEAVDAAHCADLSTLPCVSGPVVEIAAVEHRDWDMRMFAT